jgi:hypothetical protein
MRRGASGQAGANGRPGGQPGRQLGHRGQPEHHAEHQAERHLAAAPSRHLHPPILAADQSRCIARTGGLAVPRALQPSRSARHHLLWLAHSQRLGAKRVDEVLELIGLSGATRRKAGGYSLGMRQRLGIEREAEFLLVILDQGLRRLGEQDLDAARRPAR